MNKVSGQIFGSILVPGKLPTYPSPNSTLTFTWGKKLGQEMVGGQFPRNVLIRLMVKEFLPKFFVQKPKSGVSKGNK